MKRDGPYHCTGELHVRAADGTLIAELSETLLCACGTTADKPWCDRSHACADFANIPSRPLAPPRTDAFGTAPADSAQADARAALTIRTRTDGPLKITGAVEVVSPDGAVLLRGEETALCRCGHSATKPFCDGTHRVIGFSA